MSFCPRFWVWADLMGSRYRVLSIRRMSASVKGSHPWPLREFDSPRRTVKVVLSRRTPCSA